MKSVSLLQPAARQAAEASARRRRAFQPGESLRRCLTESLCNQLFIADSQSFHSPQVPVDSSPDPDCLTPSKRAFSHSSKRRRLAKQSSGFVPASSLRTFALGSWLEAPRSTASSSSSSSSSFSSSSYLTPVSVLQPRPNETNTLASPSPPPAAASSSNSLSFLTEEERRWLNSDEGGTSAGTSVRLSRFLPESELYRNVSEVMALLSTRLH